MKWTVVHVYKDHWAPAVGEELRCQREIRNMADQYAVAVIKEEVESGTSDHAVVGHLPRKISAACSLFIGGSIMCVVMSSRRYSRDLPQGGPVSSSLKELQNMFQK